MGQSDSRKAKTRDGNRGLWEAMNWGTTDMIIAQHDENYELTSADERVIAFVLNSDIRYFCVYPDAPFRVRRAFPDELLPWRTEAPYVLSVMTTGVGIVRYPLSEEDATAARAALAGITAVLIRAGVR